jgi:hypothetical protein
VSDRANLPDRAILEQIAEKKRRELQEAEKAKAVTVELIEPAKLPEGQPERKD